MFASLLAMYMSIVDLYVFLCDFPWVPKVGLWLATATFISWFIFTRSLFLCASFCFHFRDNKVVKMKISIYLIPMSASHTRISETLDQRNEWLKLLYLQLDLLGYLLYTCNCNL